MIKLDRHALTGFLVIIEELIKMLDHYNPFAKKFIMARDHLADY
jgi:hypothetical protein